VSSAVVSLGVHYLQSSGICWVFSGTNLNSGKAVFSCETPWSESQLPLEVN